MKKKLILVLFSVMTAGLNISFAQTTIPGGNVSGIWTLSGSPYFVQGAIMIANDSTLTIEPGVEVNFEGTYKLYVQGRIIAIGTASDSITFTAIDTTNGWLGIRFDNTSLTNDTSIFVYCKMHYGKATGIGDDANGGALYFENFSKANISYCQISNNMASSNGGGVYCISSSPIIKNNTISYNLSYKNAGGGIYCDSSSPIIANNNISNNSAFSSTGGGIFCTNSSSPTIVNNTISNNHASDGGGIRCLNSNVTIIGNTIINNSAGEIGGGVYCHSGNVTITDNTISNNSAFLSGGGISCVSGITIITNNTISNNSTSLASGGGIYCLNNSSTTISNNTISSNSTSDSGGGICSNNSFGTITYNVISYNSASSLGGGVYCSSSSPKIINNNVSNNNALDGGGIYCNISNPAITNNIISNNSSSDHGGGILCLNSSPAITNNTISNNDANNGGAIYCSDNSVPILSNSIIYGNIASSSGNQLFLNTEDCDPNFYYCNVEGGTNAFGFNGVFYTGIYQNNIDTIPLYTAPSTSSGTGYDGVNADWSLQSASSCIDAGTPDTTGLNLPAMDIAGNPRVYGNRVDIGAFEYTLVFIPKETIPISVNIYPNPTKGTIKLETDDIEKVEVLNVEGKLIYAGIGNDIDLSHESDGIYIIKVITDKQIITKKLIKQ